MDIIERTARLFDRVIVAISENRSKVPCFTVAERLVMLNQVLAHWDNIEIDSYADLTVRYARANGAQAIIRGLRAVSDFENEFTMALTNKKLAPEIETVFLMTEARYSFISSSAVKEVASYGGHLGDMVPPLVEEMLRAKYATYTG